MIEAWFDRHSSSGESWLKRLVVEAFGDPGEGHVVSPDDVRRWVAWHRPRRPTRTDRAVTTMLDQAAWLGVTGLGAVAGYAATVDVRRLSELLPRPRRPRADPGRPHSGRARTADPGRRARPRIARRRRVARRRHRLPDSVPSRWRAPTLSGGARRRSSPPCRSGRARRCRRRWSTWSTTSSAPLRDARTPSGRTGSLSAGAAIGFDELTATDRIDAGHGCRAGGRTAQGRGEPSRLRDRDGRVR